MLPRSRRLPRAGFEQIAGLRRAASRHFSISYIGGSSSDPSSISGGAAVVSKKVAKRSVDRHQLKRRMKAVMKPWVTPGRILIVHARTGAASLPFSELEAELTALLRQSFPSGTM